VRRHTLARGAGSWGSGTERSLRCTALAASVHAPDVGLHRLKGDVVVRRLLRVLAAAVDEVERLLESCVDAEGLGGGIELGARV
jgi:hypothetical protein